MSARRRACATTQLGLYALAYQRDVRRDAGARRAAVTSAPASSGSAVVRDEHPRARARERAESAAAGIRARALPPCPIAGRAPAVPTRASVHSSARGVVTSARTAAHRTRPHPARRRRCARRRRARARGRRDPARGLRPRARARAQGPHRSRHRVRPPLGGAAARPIARALSGRRRARRGVGRARRHRRQRALARSIRSTAPRTSRTTIRSSPSRSRAEVGRSCWRRRRATIRCATSCSPPPPATGATLNDAPIRVSDIARVEDALLVTGFPIRRARAPGALRRCSSAFLVRAQGVRRDGSGRAQPVLPRVRAVRRASGRREPVAVGHGRRRPHRARSRRPRHRVRGEAVPRSSAPRILASNGALHRTRCAR